MGIATPSSKILVTGANGFIAMWVIDTLLKGGYTVRGSVRKSGKIPHLEKTFRKFMDQGKLEFVIVDDFTKEGAFDTAVEGVDGIIHMATPNTAGVGAEDPEDWIGPAMAGTVGILKSALKHPGTLQRIIFTSSGGTIVRPVTEPTTFDESDWNNLSLQEVERLGKEASWLDKYSASKILAERAFWNFFEEHKLEVSWDVTTIIPPYVFGPALNDLDNPSQQNVTTKVWWDYVIANHPTPETVAVFNSHVDVRDLALGHVLALQKPGAGGERLIIAARSHVWQDWLDIASRHHFPLQTHRSPHLQSLGGYLPKGFPDIERKRLIYYDSSKARRLLGPELSYRSMEETAKDMLDDYIARGW